MNTIKIATIILATALLCSACAEKPEPQPDPLALERLLTTLDAPSAVAEVPSVADSGFGRRRRLERLENSISKLDVDRVDPRLAVRLIAR